MTMKWQELKCNANGTGGLTQPREGPPPTWKKAMDKTLAGKGKVKSRTQMGEVQKHKCKSHMLKWRQIRRDGRDATRVPAAAVPG